MRACTHIYTHAHTRTHTHHAHTHTQGAGTSVDFGLKVVTELVGKDKADEVSKAICFGAPLA